LWPASRSSCLPAVYRERRPPDAVNFANEFINYFGKREGAHAGLRGAGARSKLETTNDILSIVVADLYTRGAPVAASPVVRRAFDGDGYVVLELTPLEDHVSYVLSRTRPDGSVWELEDHVQVSWQPANLGGFRAWFRCSGCGRQCGRLFLWRASLVCRRCAKMRYPSQVAPQPPHAKKVARAQAIRTRLGGKPELGGPVPWRPKGMHHTTYDRLVGELTEIEAVEEERAFREGELSLIDLLVRELERHLAADRPSAVLTFTDPAH
jgi:hypothetical protein